MCEVVLNYDQGLFLSIWFSDLYEKSLKISKAVLISRLYSSITEIHILTVKLIGK